ncbi:MAG: hypothetical protein Q8O59_00225 [bacterium]|nr:hypothetical protein [bacterium]
MFDELDNKNSIPGSGARPSAPAKAQDIFSEVDPSRRSGAEADKSVKPEVLKPRDNNSSPVPVSTVIPADEGWLKNKGLIAGLIFGGLIIVIGGGYLGLRLMVKDTAPVNTEVNNNQIAPEVPAVPEVMAPAVEEVDDVVNQPIQPTIAQSVDSDLDGLTDEEEAVLGTNSNSPDTDQDGLTDREEVKVYNTDPLKADTDGDGYQDGEEVRNGFNPKGPGKLLDINNQ